MEGSDPFTAGVETSTDDPFAGTEFGDFEQHEPTEGAENGNGELKTVDREGNEVTPGEGAPAHAPSDGAEGASATGQAAQPTTEAAVDPPPAPGPAAESAGPTEAPAADPTPPSTASSPEPTGDGSVTPGNGAASAPESASAPSEASTPASTATTVEGSSEQAGGDQGSPTPASPEQPSPGAEPSSSSSEASGDEEEDAPPPEEPKDARGRATKRRYIILRVDGPGKFTQVHWYEDKDGKMLTKREPGSRRQTVALCKNVEEALKVGYAACGGPQDGVNLVATAALHFQPRVVKPLPPEPSKQRLSIS